MAEAIVQTYNLTKKYGGFPALTNLNLTIERGAIHGFIGPNGAGKTTTMRILATLLEPTAGQAWVCGYPAAYNVPASRRPAMIDDLLALVDLTAKKHSFVEELSRGMKQRLCLARTLVHEPDLLILDEPASGLDPHARIELRELLKELSALGKTILVSSHILSELAELCTHVAIIERGHLLLNGGVADILQAMQPARDIYVRVLDRAGPARAILETMPGVLSVKVLPPGYRPGQSVTPPVPSSPPTPTAPGQPQIQQGDGHAGQSPPGQAYIPPPPAAPPYPVQTGGESDAPDYGPATLHVRVNGDDALLSSLLAQLVTHDIPVFGFEEAVGDLEDIFLRTTRGLVQ